MGAVVDIRDAVRRRRRVFPLDHGVGVPRRAADGDVLDRKIKLREKKEKPLEPSAHAGLRVTRAAESVRARKDMVEAGGQTGETGLKVALAER